MTRRIWLIGGTSESATLAEAIASASLPCTVTVTSSSARMMYPPSPWLRVQVGRLEPEQLLSFCQQQGIAAIVDASHPFAVTISQAAIAVAEALNLPYLRYERPPSVVAVPQMGILELESFADLLEGDYLSRQRVFLTVGCKILPHFKPWQTKATLFARILPTLDSIQIAIAAGFPPDRLIALRPPIAADLEKALWQQWQISLVVTKASGQAGGEDGKRAIAAELGIPLIVIARPSLTYPLQTDQLSGVLSFCHHSLTSEPCLNP